MILLNLPLTISRRAKTVLREWTAPLNQLVSNQLHRFKSAGQTIRGWGGLIDENHQLTTEIVQLNTRVNELESLDQQNADLRRQLDYIKRSPRHLVPAEVIARDMSGWWQTIRLSKGDNFGIVVNQAVVTQEGLVGKVIDVTPRTCEVLLLSDPNCRVSAYLPGTETYGVMAGRGIDWSSDVLGNLDLVDKNAPIAVGDPVLTSGLGGIFPKGILVGYLDHIELAESGLFKRAAVMPSVELSALHYVFVILGEDPIDARLRSLGERRAP